MNKHTRIARAIATLVGAFGALVFLCAMYYLGMQARASWDSGSGSGSEGVSTQQGGLEPCTDDSAPNYPCSWDCEVQGNGEGESFWVDEDGVTHTWEDA